MSKDDPLFQVDDEKTPDPMREEEAKEKTNRELYMELVRADPFFREATASVKRMLSFEAWSSLRKRLEKNPPDVGDIILGAFEEEVPIIPGKLVPVFRMLTTEDWDYIINRMVADNIPPAAVMNRQMILRLAFGVSALDGTRLPYVVENGEVNVAVLDGRCTQLRRRPHEVTYLLNAHYEWFRSRIHLLLESGQVKNG